MILYIVYSTDPEDSEITMTRIWTFDCLLTMMMKKTMNLFEAFGFQQVKTTQTRTTTTTTTTHHQNDDDDDGQNER